MPVELDGGQNCPTRPLFGPPSTSRGFGESPPVICISFGRLRSVPALCNLN